MRLSPGLPLLSDGGGRSSAVVGPVGLCTTRGWTVGRRAAGGRQAALPSEGQRLVARRQVLEQPVIRTLVLELLWYRAICADCGTRNVGEQPPGFRPGATSGLRLEALLA